VPDRPTWRAVPALATCSALIVSTALSSSARPQEPAPAAAPTIPLPVPKEVPPAKLLPTLPTAKVRRGGPQFNVHMVDAAPLVRDRQGIWVLDMAFKPLRLITVEVPGRGRRVVHYLYYRVVNRTGEPRNFLPQFTLVTDTGKSYEEAVLPQAVPLIRAREAPDFKLLGAVDIAGMVPPSTKEGYDEAVFGVAVWEGIDPHADRLTIFVRGLSDGYKDVTTPDGKTVTRYKTLRIDLIRRGDARNLNEREILLADPPYEWVYR
jgi:hypothetical protein